MSGSSHPVRPFLLLIQLQSELILRAHSLLLYNAMTLPLKWRILHGTMKLSLLYNAITLPLKWCVLRWHFYSQDNDECTDFRYVIITCQPSGAMHWQRRSLNVNQRSHSGWRHNCDSRAAVRPLKAFLLLRIDLISTINGIKASWLMRAIDFYSTLVVYSTGSLSVNS